MDVAVLMTQCLNDNDDKEIMITVIITMMSTLVMMMRIMSTITRMMAMFT